MALNIWEWKSGTPLAMKYAVFHHRQSVSPSELMRNGSALSDPLSGAAYGKNRSDFPRLYTAQGTFVGTREKRQPAQPQPGQPVSKPSPRKVLEQLRNGTYMNWDNTALYDRISLTSRLLAKKEETSKMSDSRPANREKDVESSPRAAQDRFMGRKEEPQREQWAVKTSAGEVVSQMEKGAFLYHTDENSLYVQGYRESGEPDVRKMCSLDDLRTTLGYDEPKKMSVKDNMVSFDKNSVYGFTGADGKEHTVMSRSAALTEDLMDTLAKGRSEDQEAKDYADFWSGLANGEGKDIYSRHSREEVKNRLTDAGIHSGPFTVTVGESSSTYYLSREEEDDLILTRDDDV